jgi:hypothetical protein
MTTEAEVAMAAAAVTPRAGRHTLAVLRWVAVLHAVAMLAQPVLAGQYLDGDLGGLARHQLNALVVAGLDVLQLGAATAFGWRGRGRWWPTWASLAIALLVEVQVGFGYAAMLGVHVPLGVALIVGQILVTVWLFGPRAEVRRPARASVRASRRARAGGTP